MFTRYSHYILHCMGESTNVPRCYLREGKRKLEMWKAILVVSKVFQMTECEILNESLLVKKVKTENLCLVKNFSNWTTGSKGAWRAVSHLCLTGPGPFMWLTTCSVLTLTTGGGWSRLKSMSWRNGRKCYNCCDKSAKGKHLIDLIQLSILFITFLLNWFCVSFFRSLHRKNSMFHLTKVLCTRQGGWGPARGQAHLYWPADWSRTSTRQCPGT